jgi:hypothetical protein
MGGNNVQFICSVWGGEFEIIVRTTCPGTYLNPYLGYYVQVLFTASLYSDTCQQRNLKGHNNILLPIGFHLTQAHTEGKNIHIYTSYSTYSTYLIPNHNRGIPATLCTLHCFRAVNIFSVLSNQSSDLSPFLVLLFLSICPYFFSANHHNLYIASLSPTFNRNDPLIN